jgi:23S rRNA (guanosine2251-2'-O)-methyltransferase
MRHNEYLFGIHAARQVFDHDTTRIIELWLQQGREAEFATYATEAAAQGIPVHVMPKKTLDKLAEQGNHQGIVLRCKALPIQDENSLAELLVALQVPPFLLVLDGVQDPHNLGACLRTADAAGVHALIVPKDRACGLSPTVFKVACGAAEKLPVIQVTNLARTLKFLKEQGVWLVGTTGETEQDLYSVKLTGALAIVMGTEGTGLRRLTQENCDSLVRIPMFGTIESLNVSVATGICLYEAVRQRR